MKEIPIPADRNAARKKQRALRRSCTAVNILFYFCAAVAVLGLIGLFVAVVVFELKDGGASPLFGILTGSFGGGALLFAGLAFALSKLSNGLSGQYNDFLERCDGPESFFVGDGVLASFEEDALRIHGQDGGKLIWVPYAQMRIFSVCTRRAPCERGEWSVVFEIPARYLAKKSEKNAPPALVQADAKERLYRAVAAHGLPLLGEKPSRGEKQSRKKFLSRKKFVLPDGEKRRRALIGLIAGIAVIVGGTLAAIFWQTLIGSFLVAVGIVILMRSVSAFVRAKEVLALFDEGILWQDSTRTQGYFLKWSEIENITRTELEGIPVLKLQCIYGAYHVPEIDGCLDEIAKLRPEGQES